MSHLEQLDAEIARTRDKISTLEQQLQQSRTTNVYDLFAFQKDAVAIGHQKDVLRRRLADLEFERRCASPPGGSNVGAIFYGSDQ